MKSKLAQVQAAAMARIVFENFETYCIWFRSVNSHANEMFAAGNWHAIQPLIQARHAMYVDAINATIETLCLEVGANALADVVWQQAQQQYQLNTQTHAHAAWAQLFFQSVAKPLWQRAHADATPISHFSTPPKAPLNVFSCALFSDDLSSYWHHLQDAYHWFHRHQPQTHNDAIICQSIQQYFAAANSSESVMLTVQLLPHVLYAHHHALLLGRAVYKERQSAIAFTIESQNGHWSVANVVLGDDNIAALLQAPHTYLLNAPTPWATVEWLHQLLPQHPTQHIAMALGLSVDADHHSKRLPLRHHSFLSVL